MPLTKMRQACSSWSMRGAVACFWVLATVIVLAGSGWSYADGPGDHDGPFKVDERFHYDDSGIWSRNVQLGLQYSLVAAAIGVAVYEGSESRLGLTAWKTMDSMLLTAGAVQLMKVGFSRSRPGQTDDAGKFFQGNGNRSFPSGEVANVAAALVPAMLEYGHEEPWLYALTGTLVTYDAVARMKTQGHWLSDVIAGAAVGAGIGYAIHERENSLIVSPLPGGVFVGLKKRF